MPVTGPDRGLFWKQVWLHVHCCFRTRAKEGASSQRHRTLGKEAEAGVSTLLPLCQKTATSQLRSVPLCPLGERCVLKIPLKFISTPGGAGFGKKGSGTSKS